MGTSVLISTFLLTLLLGVGLFFFIRASVKDRTQSIRLMSQQSEADLLTQLQNYLTQRAYRITAVNSAEHQVVFEGFVRPSFTIATFLTILAAIGILCLVLMLSILFPNFSQELLGLVGLAPLAGFFYWRGAARLEKVALEIEAVDNFSSSTQCVVKITAHRDELAELQRSLPLQPAEVAKL